jgi:transglutaminase-like putative cysteine protease
MTFDRYFKAISYCLIGSGFAAVAATGGLEEIPVALFSAVFIAGLFIDTARLRRILPKWLFKYLALMYLPFFAMDYRLLSRSLFTAILHLIMFAAAAKLLTLSKDRDYLLLYLLSFAALLVASVLTVNMVFLLCLLIFLFSGIGALILFEMRRSNARMQSEAEVQPFVAPKKAQETGLELFSPFPARFFSVIVIGITLLILAGAIPLFFLLPRTTLGMYRRPSGNTRFISGFSDRVELGQIGRIKQSDAVVMRVKTSVPPSELPSDLKWRGLAFDYFDGRSWKRSDRTRRTIPAQGWYYKLENSAQGTDWINQTFFIEALSTNVVFAAHKALAVSRDVGLLQRDSTGSLYTAQHLKKKLRYFAVSDPIRPDPANISDLEPIPPEILHTYLQLPAEDPRIAELARQVTKTVEGRYAKARALEQYLRSHYAYSLVLGGIQGGKDPLAVFLFDVRKGHCEYFASAMTVMLRQIGIPARLVNGFHIGEYNRIGNNWIVRQYNAHTWVEAYFPPYGWIEFDPTPADPQHPRTAFARMLSDLSDAIDLWWWEGVVNYDSSKQYRLLNTFHARAYDFQNSVQSMLARAYERGRTAAASLYPSSLALTLSRNWFWGLLWSLAVFALLLIRPVRRRIWGRARRALCWSNSKALAASFYTEALELLEAHGMKRSLGQTPMEFARSLGSHPAGASVLALTRMYNAVRFGPPELHLSNWEAEAHLRSLRDSLRPKNSGQRHRASNR